MDSNEESDIVKRATEKKFQEAKKNRDFQIESYNADLLSEYGEENLIMTDSGRYAINNKNLDVSQSLTSKVTTDSSITAKLIELGLSTDGSANDKSNRLNSYNWGEQAGFTFSGMTLDPSVGAYFADVSPTALTETDIGDMDQFITAVGIDDPRVIQSLINAGIVQEVNFKTDPRNGLLTIYDYDLQTDGTYKVTKDMGLQESLETAWHGFKKGARANETFITTQEYKDMLNEEVKLDMLSAQAITGSAAANQAIKDYNDLGVVIATHIGAGNNEDGAQVMKARGTGDLVKFSDIREDILDQKGLSDVDKNKLVTFYEMLKDTDATGSNLTSLVNVLRADTSLLHTLNSYDPSLARHLSGALLAKNQIDQVSATSQSYYGDFYKTEDMNRLENMDIYLDNSGIRQAFLNFRDFELDHDPKNASHVTQLKEMASNLTNLVIDSENQLKQKGQKFDKPSNSMIWVDPTMEGIYNKLQDWYTVEEATARLLTSKGQQIILNTGSNQ